MKNNILRLKNCYGCGVCVIACPINIIHLENNQEGFYYPTISDNEKCIECGCCLEVCAYNHKTVASPAESSEMRVYGAWSKDPSTRLKSTSGGVAYEIAKKCITDHHQAIVVKYDEREGTASHYIARNVAELSASQRTKYIPSFTQSAFKSINRNNKYVIFGLPCQIDSMRRYVKKFNIEDRFKLVDLFCYGVPSLLLWRQYLLQKKSNTGVVKSVFFRSKRNGWHKSSTIEIDGEKGKSIESGATCGFYNLFFSNSCLNKCCYHSCKYKRTASAADIRLGDFWGTKYENNEEGVNIVITFTPVGVNLIDSLQDSIVLEANSITESLEGQMHNNVSYNCARPVILFGLKNGVPLTILSRFSQVGKVISNPKKYFIKLIEVLKR